ncbi:hypothetical protein GWI33_006114 [Rhynchophorus ferrugineus]|uniref:Uncharacterized protein n=1 Tax=Rhynchophorus ferrugineus TaxID=354439 RepID=A0A834IKZ5_RHYFE|nr:hypothetical protein GWI33_006114 [Rhynchophorus ferrugineus]
MSNPRRTFYPAMVCADEELQIEEIEGVRDGTGSSGFVYVLCQLPPNGNNVGVNGYVVSGTFTGISSTIIYFINV